MKGQNRQQVKKRYQISDCIFRFGEAIIIGIRFNVMQNMTVNNKFKYYNNNNNNNSILYYLCAESTATRAITDTAQCR
jgi:opacity protein-like surface antigen